MKRELKVGILTIVALAVLAGGLFLVGDRDNLFARKTRYKIRFESVAGLATGNPVQLNGVTVGDVVEIVLPEGIEEKLLTIWIAVDQRYRDRIRADSLARIKTLGLLGDKYVEISSGSPQAERIAPGGEIATAPATDVDRLLASGEDVVANVEAISFSLRNILGRMEAGEGLLGELLTSGETTDRVRGSLVGSLESLETISGKLERGEGALGTLIHDPSLAQRLEGSLARLEGVLGALDDGEGLAAGLLHDAELRRQVADTVASLGTTAERLADFTAELGADGDGLIAKLATDPEFAEQVSRELKQLVGNLNAISEKLNRGDGTLGMFINDPHLYEAIDDIVVGINESKLLRWLIRNRQKKGIETRYEEVLEAAPQQSVE